MSFKAGKIQTFSVKTLCVCCGRAKGEGCGAFTKPGVDSDEGMSSNLGPQSAAQHFPVPTGNLVILELGLCRWFPPTARAVGSPELPWTGACPRHARPPLSRALEDLSLSPPHICPPEAVRMAAVVGTVVVVIRVLAQNLLLLEGTLSCLLPLFQIYCFNLFWRFPHRSHTLLCPTSVSTCL